MRYTVIIAALLLNACAPIKASSYPVIVESKEQIQLVALEQKVDALTQALTSILELQVKRSRAITDYNQCESTCEKQWKWYEHEPKSRQDSRSQCYDACDAEFETETGCDDELCPQCESDHQGGHDE